MSPLAVVADPVGAAFGTCVGKRGGFVAPASKDSTDAFPSLRTSHIAQGYAKLKFDSLADLPKLPLSATNNMQQLLALIEGVKDSVAAMRLIVGNEHPM